MLWSVTNNYKCGAMWYNISLLSCISSIVQWTVSRGSSAVVRWLPPNVTTTPNVRHLPQTSASISAYRRQ